MAEYKRWRNESYRYDSSEVFPWHHPVLYQICTEMRRSGVERQMTQTELEALAAAAGQVGKACGGRTSDPAGEKANCRATPCARTNPAQLLKAQAEAAKLKRI
jgi:hypothetical protein